MLLVYHECAFYKSKKSPVSLNGKYERLLKAIQYGTNEFSRQYHCYGLYPLCKHGGTTDLFEYVVDIDGFDAECGIVHNKQCKLLYNGYVDD